MPSAPTRTVRDSSIVSTRSSFLASTRSSFLVGSLLASVAMSLIQPEECQAAIPGVEPAIPRYIDQEVAIPGSRSGSKVLVRRITGDATPYSFPAPRPIPLTKVWPEDPPFAASDFVREDGRDDGQFYSQPRLVYHIDEPAVAALTQYYRRTIPSGSSVLDICSSWVSHYPREFSSTMDRICATGMSEAELSLNDQVTDQCFRAIDLNVDPVLPFPDSTFDAVTCVVSIDYLIHPIAVLREVSRVLKPGGQVIVSQSNRCFPTKAIQLWLRLNDREHLELINGFLQYAGGFATVEAFDITASVPDQSRHDPMFVVRAVKQQQA
jgi:Methyltransferase domain